ncbi:MAG: Gfo/Idh/MocA family oxidoreductase, partial [Planctomycetaceae bacterium]
MTRTTRETSQFSRRRFLRTGAALASTLAAPAILRARGASEKLQLAFIGTGGRGGANLRTMTRDKGVQVVALCDVNSKNLGLAGKLHPAARTYADFRRLYETVDDIDGVVVSTTEHTHAFATMPALKAGKHVYC